MIVAACGKAPGPAAPPAQIVDLSSSIAELRHDFDAHRGEPRFVMLIAPT
jgi:hypothetical protein